MQFGIFYIVQWHESRTQEQALREALEQIELADQLGIDEVWLGEHHFSRHGLLSGLFSFAGHVAARTKRMRIGTAVSVLPFHNPVVVAEEAAMLDILSGGRFRESIDVIRRAWTEETLTYHGQFTHVNDLWVIPKPLQQPHPPLYIAVSTSPASVEYAASHNIPVIVGGPTDIMGQAPQVVKLWREQMEKYGHPHAHIDPPVAKSIYVAPTVEEAETDPIGREDFSLKILAKIGSPVSKDGIAPPGYEVWLNRQKDRERAQDPGHAGLPPLRGTPDVVRERLKLVQEQGINRIFGSFGFPGLPHDKVLRSIEMFATQVMPHFRETPTGVTR